MTQQQPGPVYGITDKEIQKFRTLLGYCGASDANTFGSIANEIRSRGPKGRYWVNGRIVYENDVEVGTCQRTEQITIDPITNSTYTTIIFSGCDNEGWTVPEGVV